MLGAPPGAASNPVVAMFYIRLGKSTVVGYELEPESHLRPSVVHVRIRVWVVRAKMQRQC